MPRKKNLIRTVPFLLLSAPAIAFASDTVKTLVDNIISYVLNPVGELLLTLAVVMFLWGLVKYIKSTGEKDKNEGKNILTWGVVAMFVLVSVWGLVHLLQGVFLDGISNTPDAVITIPSVAANP